MGKFRITWEERYSTEVNAKSQAEANEKFEGLSRVDMDKAYDETTFLDIEKVK